MAAATFIYLASQSPRRRALLQQIGVAFRVLDTSVDETALRGETATAYVTRIAKSKARAAYQHRLNHALAPHPILAADTCVALGRRIVGKPRDAAEAKQILHTLSGREHRVITAVVGMKGNKIRLCCVTTKVRFRALSKNEIAHYVASGEALDKAGAYAIQGLAGAFISRISGSYTNVVGLPLYETATLLKSFGMPVL